MDHDIFLSYRRTDQELARSLVGALESRGIRVWWDEKIEAGVDWRDAIVDNLTESAALVILFSADCNSSKQLRKELALADHLDKDVIPILIEDTQPKGHFLYELASRNWIQAFPDPGSKLDKLVASLLGAIETGDPLMNDVEAAARAVPPGITESVPPASVKTQPAKPKTKKRSPRDFLPFRWFDIIPIGALAWAGSNWVFRLGIPGSHEIAGWILVIGSALAVYGGLAFPIRYYLRKRPPTRTFGMLLLSNLTLALVLVGIMITTHKKKVDRFTVRIEDPARPALPIPRKPPPLIGQIRIEESKLDEGLKRLASRDALANTEVWQGVERKKAEEIAKEVNRSTYLQRESVRAKVVEEEKKLLTRETAILVGGAFVVFTLASFLIYVLLSAHRAIRGFRSNVKKV